MIEVDVRDVAFRSVSRRLPRSTGRRLGSLLATVTLVAVTSCAGPDHHQLYVINDTGQEWMIRVDRGGQWSGVMLVTHILPGADGLSVSWIGEADTVIELLDTDCHPIGTFAPTGDGSVAVTGVPRLQGWIQPYLTNIDRLTTDEILDTAQCGGFMPM